MLRIKIIGKALQAGSGIDDVTTIMPKKEVNETTRKTIQDLCSEALETYQSGKQFSKAVNLLSDIHQAIIGLNNFDTLIIMRLEHILENYRILQQKFHDHLQKQFPEVLNKFFNLKQRDLFSQAEKYQKIYNKMQDYGILAMQKENQKYAWYQIVDEQQALLQDKIYIGKK